VGAVLAELHTGYVLFQNDSVPTMLSRITGILGQFPQHVLQRGKDTGKYFSLSNIVYERDEEGSFHLIFPKRTDLASRLHVAPDATGKLSVEDEQFVDFVRQMLHLDPNQRMSAEQALAHPWLADADTVYVSEYIIQQNPVGGDGQHPVPGEYGMEEEGSEEASGDEEEGSGDEEYDYEDEEDELAAAEGEAALQYLLNAHGGNVEAMEAYLRHLQMQQEGNFEYSGEEGYDEADEGEQDDDDQEEGDGDGEGSGEDDGEGRGDSDGDEGGDADEEQ
jgi:serine/threonine protein kinase